MSMYECDERATYVKGQAAYLAFVAMMFVLIAEMGATALKPDLFTWNGFPAGYLLPVLIGTVVFFGYSVLHRTIGKGVVRSAMIGFGVGAVVAVAFALKRLGMF